MKRNQMHLKNAQKRMLPEEKRVEVTSMKATSRMAVKIRDNFYTIEYTEERSVPSGMEIDLEEEKMKLFDSVNSTVDKQVEDIVRRFK